MSEKEPIINDKFNANEWFVENEEEIKAETAKNLTRADRIVDDISNIKGFKYNDNLKSFQKLINNESKITSKMAKNFAKKLNPSLCATKKILGIISLITLILGVVFVALEIPISLVFIIAYFKVSNKVSTLKKTITSLKTPEKFEFYYEKVTSAQYTNLPFRYDERAVYNSDNAIFSIDNICLIYTAGKKVHFGTIKGDLIKFDKSLSKENQDSLIKILKTANPDIMIGKEYITELNKLIKK